MQIRCTVVQLGAIKYVKIDVYQGKIDSQYSFIIAKTNIEPGGQYYSSRIRYSMLFSLEKWVPLRLRLYKYLGIKGEKPPSPSALLIANRESRTFNIY